MPHLHDAAARRVLVQRVEALRPDAVRHWGKMTVDQMLWHVNRALENSLGRYPVKPIRVPLPSFLLKLIVITLPWRKGNTPTAPEYLATVSHDFGREHATLLALIQEFAAVPVSATWSASSLLGPMTGQEWSRLMWKHVDHHLRQFGA